MSVVSTIASWFEVHGVLLSRMRGPFREACNSSAIIGNQHANGKEIVQESNLPEIISPLGSICDRSSHVHCMTSVFLGYQVGDKQVVLTRVVRSLNELEKRLSHTSISG